MNPFEIAVNLIKRFEGVMDGDPKTVNLDPYLDPVGIWTIGWGHAIRDANGKYITGKENRAAAQAVYPKGITKKQAELLLRTDLQSFSGGVKRAVTVQLADYQWGAIMSFAFNVGMGNFRSSTMLKLINRNAFPQAANEFAKWNKSGGKVLNGLITRRAVEADTFRGVYAKA